MDGFDVVHFSPPIWVRRLFVFLQETFVVEDCWKYDTATINKSSSYTCNNNIALTHDTDHYIAVSGVGNNQLSNYYGLIDTNVAFTDGIVIECDLKHVSGTRGIFGVLMNNNLGVTTSNHSTLYQLSSFASKKGISTEPWSDKRTNGALSDDTWYHFQLIISNGKGTGIIKAGNTIVFNDSLSYSYFTDLSKICLTVSEYPQTIHFKNIKVKAL